VKIAAAMVSCRQREAVRAASLASFAETDWRDGIEVVIDESRHEIAQRRIEETFLRVLRAAAEGDADFTLMLEDDIEPNRHLRHNLERWPPLRAAAAGERPGDRPFLGSLYRCCQPVMWSSPERRFLVGVPEAYWGGQALVVSRATARHTLERWTAGMCAHDAQMPLLASQLSPIYFHRPSLVQHRTVTSTWGNGVHVAADFDREFRVG
jgi:hypothetical protein